MPRLARIDAAGLLHHVMVRGIEKRDIFLDDHDRRFFLDRFSKLLLKTDTTCLAWCLMPNHFHLLLRPQKAKLSFFMRRLLTSYAVTFNLRHDRVGHLFQNRFRSIVCQDEPYLLELIRYIHLNPVRAGLVDGADGLRKYRWSGHGVLMGEAELPGQNAVEVLARFGKDHKEARRNYRSFVINALGEGHRDEFSGGGMARSGAVFGNDPGEESCDSRILGRGRFVEEVLYQQPQKAPQPEVNLERLLRHVADAFEVESESLRHADKSRKISQARAVTCYYAVRELGISGLEVATFLRLTPAAVSLAANRGEAIVKRQGLQILNS